MIWKGSVGAATAGALLAMALAGPARADVKIESTLKTSGLGGIGAMAGTMTELIKGDKKKQSGDVKFTGRFMRALTRGASGESDSILRLDRDVEYRINPKDKTYTELSLAEARAQMEQAAAEMQKASKSGKKDEDVKMLPPEIDVKRPGEKKTVNGFDCEHVIINMLLPFENTKTGEKGAMKFVSDMWVAPIPQAQKELTAFNKLYAEKLGIDAQAQAYRGLLGPQGGNYAEGMKDLAKKAQDLNGYPIATTVSMGDDRMGTPQAAEAARQPEEKKEEGSPLGKLGGLGGLFGKKKKQEPPPEESTAVPAPTASAGALMSITTEVKSITFDIIPDSEFEVPAGFKKVEAKKK